METLEQLRGCGTALVTPFKKDGNLDEAALLRLVDFQIEEGIDFLVPCGSTGESATLNSDEQARVVELVIGRVRGRVPVVAGAGGNNTARVIETARKMETLGADGILSVTPYYNRPNQEGLVAHYKAISDSIKIPIIVYNVPARTATNLLPATLQRLSTLKNIIGVKEASGNIGQFTEIAMTIPAPFKLISGDDANTLPIIALGGVGVISVISNEMPRLMTRFTHLCLEGNTKEALILQQKLFPLMQANFIDTNPIPVKAALARMGMIEEVYRLPLVPLSSQNKEKLESVLKQMELIP